MAPTIWHISKAHHPFLHWYEMSQNKVQHITHSIPHECFFQSGGHLIKGPATWISYLYISMGYTCPMHGCVNCFQKQKLYQGICWFLTSLFWCSHKKSHDLFFFLVMCQLTKQNPHLWEQLGQGSYTHPSQAHGNITSLRVRYPWLKENNHFLPPFTRSVRFVRIARDI